MSTIAPTALIADDEPLLREELSEMLRAAWPELQIVAHARNGREAIERFDALQPAICFLDVHMPGLSGVDAARHIDRRAHVVFVTAFDQYAVSAFEQGALDYLVKPVQPARLADTVKRLQERLLAGAPARIAQALLQQLAVQMQPRASAPAPLKWIRAGMGSALQLIAVEAIDFLRADDKYTLVAWRTEDGRPSEAVIRAPLKDLLAQLDATQFVQVHRSVVVNLRCVRQVIRGANETADIHLKGRDEVLPVSRTFLHHFRQM